MLFSICGGSFLSKCCVGETGVGDGGHFWLLHSDTPRWSCWVHALTVLLLVCCAVQGQGGNVGSMPVRQHCPLKHTAQPGHPTRSRYAVCEGVLSVLWAPAGSEYLSLAASVAWQAAVASWLQWHMGVLG